MDVLDLFSGIGGFALGFERAGMRTIGFCESDPFCREWLGQEWPDVPIYPDVRVLDGRAVGHADVVCGGFPCQDVSAAGKGEGLDGARSGLWFEMLRIVREVRPTWVVIENVPALRTRGADRVLGDLEESGYTCWPFVVGADDIGASHRRKRVWIIARRMADADGDAIRQFQQWVSGGWARGIRDQGTPEPGNDGAVADAHHAGCEEPRRPCAVRAPQNPAECAGAGVADAHADAGHEWSAQRTARRDERAEPARGGSMADAPRDGLAGGSARQRIIDGGGERGGPIYVGEVGEARGAVADAEGRGLRADGRAPGSAGHPHERGQDVLADSDGGRREGLGLEDDGELGGASGDISHGCGGTRPIYRRHCGPGVGDAVGARTEAWLPAPTRGHGQPAEPAVTDHRGVRRGWPAAPGEVQHEWEASRTVSDAECRLGAAADGLPAHLGPTLNRARLKAAGNTIVPLIAEIIGRTIVRLTP